MSDHLLDNATWHALTTRLAHVAQGNDRAVRMHPDFGLFAAPRDFSRENLAALAALIPPGGTIGVAELGPLTPPPGTRLVQQMLGHQMVAHQLDVDTPDFAVTPLGNDDAGEMLALATLTEPGPFFRRTNELGDFVGVRVDGKLVAMAGERLRVEGFTEISAVCTHPDHRGRGYARGLMGLVAAKIASRGETPILHVWAQNKDAIALYQRMGFGFRREMPFTVLERA